MIEKQKFDELLKLPAEERRRVLRLLQESLPTEPETQSISSEQDLPSPSAQWLLTMAGRFSGGPGNSAANADEIIRGEIDSRGGLTTK